MKDFQQIQRDFVAHIRHPAKHPAPDGVTAERMAVYSDLLFNNVEGFLASAYPVLKSLYQPEHWYQLIRRFFQEHRCASPFFADISEHFLLFLQHYEPDAVKDPAFLLELAHYEWLELYLSLQPAETPLSLQHEANPWQQPLQLSALTKVVGYYYPVDRISAQFQPTEASSEPYYYLLYRSEDDEVHFMRLNAASALLLQLLEQQPGIHFAELQRSLLEQAPQLASADLASALQELLSGFIAKGIVQRARIG
ncbi:MAG: putative DNA-binding domain-containing protein [Alkalimonas sp.]|nr:putative DNA-binding domain-containing protein [Alkalimonas sp.]